MISVGILSYNSPLTLKNTLMSYKHYGLLEYSDDVFCVLQPSSKINEEMSICDIFGIRYYLQESNDMMLGGMKRIFKEAKNEFVLWTENDFRIHTVKKKVKKIIEDSEKLIKNNVVGLVKIRSLKLPGHPISVKEKYYNKMSDTSKLDYSLYYDENPHVKFSDNIQKYSNDPIMYIMNSKYCGYSNNCFITSKKFFNDIILNFSKGDPHIEPDIDKIWSNLNISIGISEGFLTHVRLDGHNSCWCCHTDFGGVSNEPKCTCCISEYKNNIDFIIDENGNDVSNFQSGSEWIKFI